MTLDEIKKRLKESNLKAVATAAGIHHNALYRLMNGGTNPSYETVRKLIDYINSLSKTGQNND